MPGEFEPVIASDDSLVSVLAEALAVAGRVWRGRTLRVATAFTVCAVIGTLALIANVLAFAWAFIGVFFVMYMFGPVMTASLVWATFWAFVSLTSFACVLARHYWIPVVEMVAEELLAINAPISVTIKRYLAEVASQHNVRARQQHNSLPKPVTYNGKVYTFETLSDENEHGVGTRFAVLTFMLFAPSKEVTWSNVIFGALVFLMSFHRRLYYYVKKTIGANWFMVKTTFCIVWIVFACDLGVVSTILDWATLVFKICLYPIWHFWYKGSYKDWRAFVRLVTVIVVLRITTFAMHLELIMERNSGDPSTIKRSRSLRAFWNQTIMRVTSAVDKISVPNFIRTMPDRFDAEGINETQKILENLGWPASPEVVRGFNPTPKNIHKFVDHVIGTTSIRQGIASMRLQVAEELSNLAGLAPEYKRSEQFASFENELESVSRYFTADPVDIPDIGVDEVWVLVGSIFEHSVLTPFSAIIKKWEKKYGLGPFWGDPASMRFRKLSRRKFIKMIGGIPNLVKLWAKTFEIAPALVPVAGVSIKSEALPPKKWMNDIVRTVISAPITHYISSTFWNYGPNHRFNWTGTNIKVGMPLNGFWLSDLWQGHARYDFHFAGDFEAFDSTVQGKVSKLVAQVRKKGFEHHRDYAKICFLIDTNYHSLEKMPLMTTSTGNVYAKAAGLSTGHSSTSMDNSLAVTIYYLCAWKQLTGLSAHEFRYFCKLSNYGDDHLLSWLRTAPTSWTPENIMKTMKRYGVGLRDEEPSRELLKMQFLSKFARLSTPADRPLFKKIGINCPRFLVYHNPDKLVGKAYAPSKDIKVDVDYRAKRLISYLGLTAHQPDLYDKIFEDIGKIKDRRGRVPTASLKVPTYEQVVKDWYTSNKSFKEEDEDIGNDGQLLTYSARGPLDGLVSFLAVVPDVLNPAIYNMGYTNYLLKLAGPRVAWPLELLRRSNECMTYTHLAAVAKKTPYDFLAASPDVLTINRDDLSDIDLLLRHWLFNFFNGFTLKVPIAKAVANIDKKLGDINFLFNGHVQSSVRSLDPQIIRLLLAFTVDLLPPVNRASAIIAVRLPNLANTLNMVAGMLFNRLWAIVPANMKDMKRALASVSDETPAILGVAPTGSGKSTTLVTFINDQIGHLYDRVVVVEPRAILPITLVPYLRHAFNAPAVAVGYGMPADPDARLIVTTAQEVFLHSEWLSSNTLFIVDECHVEEAAYLCLQEMLTSLRKHRIMLTATPSEENKLQCNVEVPLRVANVWQIFDTGNRTVDISEMPMLKTWQRTYAQISSDLANASPLSKFLIFVSDIAEGENIANKVTGAVCLLSSKSKVVDPDARVFVATSVGDVGLTLPDVDWVVTSDVQRQMVTKALESTPVMCRLGEATLKQRRGRTGRTCNGRFTLIKTQGSPAWLVDWAPPTRMQRVYDLYKGGCPPTLIAQFYPDFMSMLLGSEYSRDMDGSVDKLVTQLGDFGAALNESNLRDYTPTADGRAVPDIFTVFGNTLLSGEDTDRGPNRKTSGRKLDNGPLRASRLQEFVLRSAITMVKRNVMAGVGNITAYFRTRAVKGATVTALKGVLPSTLSSAQKDAIDGAWSRPKPTFLIPDIMAGLEVLRTEVPPPPAPPQG